MTATGRGAWWGLAVLVTIGLYTYADRQIIGLQGEAIRASLGLNDFQFGIVQGASVALATVLLAYPIGWLADRFDRRRVLAGCLVAWCAAVALCGAASSFTELALASALVGAAEAGLLPIAYATIPEWFRGRARPSANSTFVLLGRLSAGLVIIGCGWLLQSIDTWRHALPSFLHEVPTWRLALWITALPGLALVVLVARLPAMQAASPAVRQAGQGEGVLAVLRERAAVLVPCFLGGGLLALGANAMGTFVPVAAARVWGLSPSQAGNGLGLAALAGAVFALLATLALTRRADLARRPAEAMRWAAVAMAAAALTLPLVPLAPGPTPFFVIYGVGLAFTMSGVMLLPTAIQPVCPPPQRVRLMSIYITTVVVMSAAGPAIAGAASDALGGSGMALLASMAGTALAGHLASAALLARGARRCEGKAWSD